MLKGALILMLVLLLAVACGGDSKPLPATEITANGTDEATVQAVPSPTPTVDVKTTPISTLVPAAKPPASQERGVLSKQYLQSIVECLNRVLGTSRAREIVESDNKPTEQEVIVINDCSKPEPDEARSYDTPRGTPRPGVWDPSPSQASCLFSAIGMSAFREIFQGDRLSTPAEIENAQPCLPGAMSLLDLPHPLSTEQCPSLEILQRYLEEYQPRWDQLECHMEGLKRLPIPSFRTSARINPLVLMEPPGAEVGCQGLLCPQGTEGVIVKDLWNGDLDVLLESLQAESWEEFAGGRYAGSRLDHLAALQFTEAEFPSANFTYLPANVFRPKTDELGQRLAFPITDYWHDAGLRAFAVHAILRKQAGRITPMEFGFGGSKDVEAAKTPEEFRRWIDEIFIPQKVYEAGFAERLKIETYKPWMTEIDIWIMDQSWALGASDEELLETGQYLLDSVVAAVRPHFKGRITPHTWQHGSAVHDAHPRPVWKQLTFKGLDEVGVTYFPRCDMETTLADARVQFELVMAMVKRDSIPWVISEMDTNHKGFEFCGTDLFDQADEIWSAVLDLISELEIQPIGISTKGFGNIYSEEHKAVLEEKVFSRGTD